MLLDCSAVTQILTLATHAISHVMPAKTTISGLEEVIENYKIIRGHLPISVRVMILIFNHFTNPMEIVDFAI